MDAVPFIVGPTGVGKTKISILISQKLPVEIISADSRQIYQLLNIGTAKPSPKTLLSVPHHFINYLSPDEYFSAGMYGREARNKINQLFKKQVIPLVVGGSGFYIQALIDGLSEIDATDQDIRDKLRHRFEKDGVERLHKELNSVDPDLAKSINIKDQQRVLRGLEVYYVTGKPLSKLQLQKPIPADFKAILIGLDARRDVLYNMINNRVDQMIHDGLVDEVQQLKNMGFSEKNNALNTVGYKEVFQYLDNNLRLSEMVEKIKINTRRYAKRQLTWFRKDDRIHWLQIDQYDEIENIVEQIFEIFKRHHLIQ